MPLAEESFAGESSGIKAMLSEQNKATATRGHKHLIFSNEGHEVSHEANAVLRE
jgi:hypothetical protein